MFVIQTPVVVIMNPLLFLSLVIILSAALPWWPYSAYGRLRNHRPWDWLFDTQDFGVASEASIGRIGARPTPEASQKVTMNRCDDSETQGDALLNEFKERWIALEQREAPSVGAHFSSGGSHATVAGTIAC
jgi:hypothetical protein